MNNVQYQERTTYGRPCGVTLMAIFQLLQGIFLIIAGVLGVIGIVVVFFDAGTGGSLLFHGAIDFILGILSLILSIGLFTQARWAFWATVVIAALNVVNSVFALIQSGFAAWGHIFSLAISLVILIYFLTNDRVRMAFRT
jgi:hypothetical protein